MRKPTTIQTILGENFTKAREKQGLSTADLAIMAILSENQIEQIENGGSKSFYTAAIKIQSAKKVAKILGLTDQEAFEFKDKKDSQQLLLQLSAIEPSEPIEILKTKLEEKGQINLAPNTQSKQALKVKKKLSVELEKISSIGTHLNEVIATANTNDDHQRRKTISYFKVFAYLVIAAVLILVFALAQQNHGLDKLKIKLSHVSTSPQENQESNLAEVRNEIEPAETTKVPVIETSAPKESPKAIN
jgi:transcriptional regulator with XRE-family HTH domain